MKRLTTEEMDAARKQLDAADAQAASELQGAITSEAAITQRAYTIYQESRAAAKAGKAPAARSWEEAQTIAAKELTAKPETKPAESTAKPAPKP